MSFNLNNMKFLLDKFCGLLKKLKNNGNNNSSGGNGNSGGSSTISITVNINIGKGNDISNLHFITTDELSKIKTFDATIKKSVKITTDDISLWMYCNTGNRHECFALGIYLKSSKYDSDKMALWIGLHTGHHTEAEPQAESLLKKNLILEIEFLGKGWSNSNLCEIAVKGKGDEHYHTAIEGFEEKSPEELLALITAKLEEALKDKYILA